MIPNFNGVRWLPGILESVARQTRAPAEVLVVDDGSTDGSLALLAERFPAVRVLALGDERRLRARRRTRACGRSGAEAVALVNTDVRLAPDWLERALARAAADPGRGRGHEDGRPRRPVAALRRRRRAAPRRRLRAARALRARRRAATTSPARCSRRAPAPRSTGARRCSPAAASTSASAPTSRTSSSACACGWRAGAAAGSRARSPSTPAAARPARCATARAPGWSATRCCSWRGAFPVAVAPARRLPAARLGLARRARGPPARAPRGRADGAPRPAGAWRGRRALRASAAVPLGTVVPRAADPRPARRRAPLPPRSLIWPTMPHRRRLVVALTGLALAFPSTALAQSAGDDQYSDPFGGGAATRTPPRRPPPAAPSAPSTPAPSSPTTAPSRRERVGHPGAGRDAAAPVTTSSGQLPYTGADAGLLALGGRAVHRRRRRPARAPP